MRPSFLSLMMDSRKDIVQKMYVISQIGKNVNLYSQCYCIFQDVRLSCTFVTVLFRLFFPDTSLKTEENEDEAKIEPEMTDLSRYFRTPSNELNLTLLNEAFKASSHSSSVLVGLEYRDVVFLSENNSIIVSHVGATVVIPCRVKKESNFGMVTYFFHTLCMRMRLILLRAELLISITLSRILDAEYTYIQ